MSGTSPPDETSPEVEGLPNKQYEADLPPNWQHATDSWGRVYYVNHLTMESQWERPVAEEQPVSTFALLRHASKRVLEVAPPSYEHAVATGADPMHTLSTVGEEGTAVAAASAESNAGVRIGEEVGDDSFERVAFSLRRSDLGEAVARDRPDGPPSDPSGASNRYDGGAVVDRLAMSRQRSFRVERDIQGGFCRTRCCSTIANNKFLTVVTVIMWALLGSGTALIVNDPDSSGGLAILIVLAVIWGLYWMIFIIPTGCSPLCMYCCTTSSCCVGDYVVEAVQAEECSDFDSVRSYVNTVYSSPPVLTLHVTCSHTRTTGTGKRRRSQRIVTYRGSTPIVLLAHRDVSVHPHTFISAVEQNTSSSYLTVSYKYDWDSSLEGRNQVNVLKREYYNANRWRDRDTSVSLSYNVGGNCDRRVDVIAINKGFRYCIANTFINRWCLYLAMYSTLYLPYMCLYKICMRPYTYNSTKFIVPQGCSRMV